MLLEDAPKWPSSNDSMSLLTAVCTREKGRVRRREEGRKEGGESESERNGEGEDEGTGGVDGRGETMLVMQVRGG